MLGARFEQALVFAAHVHADQRRKGTEIPYIAHPLAVASLVLEDGGDEDEAIAALLHDVAEDRGGAQTLREIERQFGARVAGIVRECSDTLLDPKPPWRPRKEAFLRGIADATPEALRVEIADKLHNARCVLSDLRQVGDALWSRFNAGKDDVLWYYRSCAKAFARARPGPLAAELGRVVAEIEALASRDST